ncbi:MAG: choline-binding protein [Schleiferilactobacillus harbinensis]|jgi:hypothetical protein|nr:choline-binding protein [Schleiferilactobacillus harbinensis]MCI1913109.1 choline-binding protein [Schleiferilactobacillus harbinensis]
MKKTSKWVKLMAVGVVLIGIVGTATVVSAATWTITTVYVPNLGFGSRASGLPNIKQSSSTYASFNGDDQHNALGYNVHLMDYYYNVNSDWTGLWKNSTSYAGHNTGKQGQEYYSDVHSQYAEPNGDWVRLHFSADRK